MDTGLNGRTALVTGASGGIGQATARMLAGEGVRVAAHYHRNRDAAEAVAATCGGAVALGADLRDEAAVNVLFDDAEAALGPIEILVVNAGVWIEPPAPLHTMTLAQWRETIDTDLTSAFLTCRRWLRRIAEDPPAAPAAVLVASTAALFGEADHADYAAAKAGLAYGLTRSLKNEIARLAPRGRVNCVCPGWTATPMAAAALEDDALVARVTATMPLKKVAAADDVAAAITWLASDRCAGHVTGAILPVAGGMEGRTLGE